MSRIPERIICIFAESADWLWRIGAWDNVVGITAFLTPPSGAPVKPRVSGFSAARLEEIAALNPDLIITFSDVQAQLSKELIQLGFPVLATNHRTLAEIEAALSLLGRAVGRVSSPEQEQERSKKQDLQMRWFEPFPIRKMNCPNRSSSLSSGQWLCKSRSWAAARVAIAPTSRPSKPAC